MVPLPRWSRATPSLLLASGEKRTGGEVQAKAHLKDSSPPGACFPPPFWWSDVPGWSQLPLPRPPLHVHMHNVAREGKVPGNFGVSPGKTWSRKGSFTCQHTSWKPPGLPSLLLLLVSHGVWFKRSLNVNHVKFLCSCQ